MNQQTAVGQDIGQNDIQGSAIVRLSPRIRNRCDIDCWETPAVTEKAQLRRKRIAAIIASMHVICDSIDQEGLDTMLLRRLEERAFVLEGYLAPQLP